MDEIWKKVVGYEDSYEISNLGNVRALYRQKIYKARWGLAKMVFPAKQMKIGIGKNGYCYVKLSKDSKNKHKLIHRLVMEAFVGYSDLEVNHKDGNKENNRIENLEYCTAQENQLHCTRILKKKIGEKNKMSKLKEADIFKIRNDPRILREIAMDYGVTLQAIHYVKNRKNWSHIQEKTTGDTK